MKDQDINSAIAGACGIKVREIIYNKGTARAWVAEGLDPIPDYCNDLNAMHEAEKVMFLHWNEYIEVLIKMRWDEAQPERCEPDLSIVRATARQRAEAFLRTIGKWRD